MSLRRLATLATLQAARDVLDVRVRWVRLWRLVIVLLVPAGPGRWWRRARVLLLWAMVACGPVGTPATETPTEATARRAITAGLRAAQAKVCRATLPPVGAHPLHVVAWAMACDSHPVPAVVSPALPPASPPRSPR